MAPGVRMLGCWMSGCGRKPFRGLSGEDRMSGLSISGDTRGFRSWTRVISRATTAVSLAATFSCSPTLKSVGYVTSPRWSYNSAASTADQTGASVALSHSSHSV
eukprot:6389792-Prymnesium_polylepis.1